MKLYSYNYWFITIVSVSLIIIGSSITYGVYNRQPQTKPKIKQEKTINKVVESKIEVIKTLDYCVCKGEK